MQAYYRSVAVAICATLVNTHTHTHTHKERETETDRQTHSFPAAVLLVHPAELKTGAKTKHEAG